MDAKLIRLDPDAKYLLVLDPMLTMATAERIAELLRPLNVQVAVLPGVKLVIIDHGNGQEVA